MPRGQAKKLFEEYKALGYERIARALQSDEAEQENCDFKEFRRGKPKPAADPEDEGHWRQVLGKSASGFANATGGVIVWGIEAKGLKPLNDSPIQDVSRAEKELNDAYSKISDPKLEIEYVRIDHPTNPAQATS